METLKKSWIHLIPPSYTCCHSLHFNSWAISSVSSEQKIKTKLKSLWKQQNWLNVTYQLQKLFAMNSYYVKEYYGHFMFAMESYIYTELNKYMPSDWSDNIYNNGKGLRAYKLDQYKNMPAKKMKHILYQCSRWKQIIQQHMMKYKHIIDYKDLFYNTYEIERNFYYFFKKVCNEYNCKNIQRTVYLQKKIVQYKCDHYFVVTQAIHNFIKFGALTEAQNLIVKTIASNFDVFPVKSIVNKIVIHYYHSFIMMRFGQYKQSITHWNKYVETKWQLLQLQDMLFEHNVDCEMYPFRLRNTSLFELKVVCYVGMKQFDKAQNVIDFYTKLWGEDDQTWYHQAYLDMHKFKLCRNVNMKAMMLADLRNQFCEVPMQWKPNQHFWCAKWYHYYDINLLHSQFHYVCCIVRNIFQDGFNDVIYAEYFYHLSQCCYELKEWKLSKYFLNKAYKITKEIPLIKQNYI
eukprot:447371_1